ncbi:MAG: thermonuclease family protein [Anaerolineae bacterium]|nr:thermonuclease family protein [Anaerolineae bacterium]
MVKTILSIPKLLILVYLAIVTHLLARAVSARPWFVKLLHLAGVLILLALPVWTIYTLINSANPKSVPAPQFILPTPVVRTASPSQPIQVTVSSVVNGDTVDVQIDANTNERVRLLGLDAPEPWMCFGDRSAEGAGNLLQGQRVWLEADSSLPNRDKFGRLSRYVRLMDGRLANQALIEQGYAFEYTYFSPYDYREQFRAAEARARSQSLGIWADMACSASAERPEHVIQAFTLQMPPDVTRAEVTRVVDGDTIEVSIAGNHDRIRLIGIDTPEYGRCYADEATARQVALTANQVVLLEADTSQDDRDKYGRLLRYVWLPDGRMVNAILVAEGYAFEYTYRDPYRYVEEFMQLEHGAHLVDLGLWASTTCDGIAGRRYSSAYDWN